MSKRPDSERRARGAIPMRATATMYTSIDVEIGSTHRSNVGASNRAAAGSTR